MEQKPSYAELKDRIEKLKKAEDELNLIFELSPDLVGTADLNTGYFTRVNHAWKIFGRSLEEFTQRPFLDLVHPDDKTATSHAVGAMQSGQFISGFENRYRCKDGSYRIIEWRAASSQSDGKAFVAGRDITERKQAEKALIESEDLFKHIFETANVGKSITLPTGKIRVNKAFAELLGYSREELSNKTWQEVTLPDEIEANQKFLSPLLKGEQDSARFDKRYLHKNGSPVWADVSVAIRRDTNGQPLHFITTIVDITERKRWEEENEKLQTQLHQSQKMESIGRLAGGVAHDYNNISSIIMGYAELALEQVNQEDPLHEDLTEILTAAKRSTDITRQLLAFARRQTIAPKVVDLNDIIGNMLKMFQRLIGENIHLAWLPGTGVWPVKIDPSQIDQIIANLAVNARDAITDVGKVTIETQNIYFDEDYCTDHAGFIPGDFVLLAISDDGHGIAPELLDKIFEPFFTTKGLGKGTGLGLSTVYGIVKQNDGFINVYSELKQGTTIKIYLPRHKGQVVKAHRNNSTKIPLSRGETVFLVEDDDSILKLGKRMLEELGYIVVSTSSPREVIKLAKEHTGKIHLLITDVIMPEMNGRELSEHLQTLYPNLKTLFMSGYTANVIAHRGVLYDEIFFMPKPFSKEEIAVKVREVLDKA